MERKSEMTAKKDASATRAAGKKLKLKKETVQDLDMKKKKSGAIKGGAGAYSPQCMACSRNATGCI
jgi:hypothetical protein